MRKTTAQATGGLAAATANWLFSIAGIVVVWMLKQAFKVAAWLTLQGVRHPRTTLGIGTLSGLVVLVGWQVVVAVIGALLLTGSVWKAAHRASFEATVGAWLRTWFRRWWTYRRRWERVLSRCGLVVEHDDERHFPRLRKVSTTPYWDRLELQLQVGQDQSDFDQAADRLRHAFGAERLVVRELQPGWLGIDAMRRDPFRHIKVPATPMPATVEEIDWSAVPTGVDEFGEVFTESMVGGHRAGAGRPGAGKSSFIWNPLRGMAPAIAAGLVKPILIDPKAKELRQALPLVDAGVYGCKHWVEDEKPRGTRHIPPRRGVNDRGENASGDYAVTEQDTVMLLERVAAELADANERDAAAGERDFVPSLTQPMRPIFIDEFAPLLKMWSRSSIDRIYNALGIIATQGRAAGYIVHGLIQEPTKDVFTIRDMFARRVGFGLPTEDHTDAILTDNAALRGAECHRIPESLPGVAFAFLEGDKTARRVRYGHVTNDDIAELVDFVRIWRAEHHNVVPLHREPVPVDELGAEGQEGAA
uniref:hypothetical protein n=1 Tax=Amycolatopsis sp. CA-290885 TaxID=3239925 RepID=UPI003F493388